jgi:NAD-specific glutamate dehydrogenase
LWALILALVVVYQYGVTIQNKNQQIRKNFINVESEDKQLETLNQILEEQQKTNHYLANLDKEKRMNRTVSNKINQNLLKILKPITKTLSNLRPRGQL